MARTPHWRASEALAGWGYPAKSLKKFSVCRTIYRESARQDFDFVLFGRHFVRALCGDVFIFNSANRASATLRITKSNQSLGFAADAAS